MSTTCYGNQAEFDSVAYGSLAVILPMLERMGVREIIDRHLPADVQAEFGDGEILSLLIAARMYSPVALSNVSEWARVSGADIATGIPAEKLNDDRLGRCLDHFFRQRHSILASIALHVSQTFGVPLREVHYDPTHILFTGAYAGAAARRGVVVKQSAEEEAAILSDDLLEPAHITKGRAMDDVPKGAKMIHAGLCVQVDEYGPLPIFGHTIDGNQNGRHAVHEQFELLLKHLPSRSLTIISDRGTFSVGHLLRLKDGGCDALCSVPWGEFQELFDERFSTLKWKPASYLSTEQQRRRQTGSELPLEEYQLAVLRQTLNDDQSGRSIDCRVIFVHSTADQKVIRQQRQKQIERITAELQKIQALIAAGRGKTDEASLAKRLARILESGASAE
jgi:transposase